MKKFLFVLLLPLSVYAAPTEKEGFISLTQIPQTESGDVSSGINGWKNLFPPNRTGFSWRSVDETINLQQFKIFIPPGAKFSTTGGYLPQQAQYAIVASINKVPNRKSSLTQIEYSSHSGENSNPNTMFNRMLNGEEVISVHDGGGAKSLSGVVRLSNPLKNGVWIYGRVLPIEGLNSSPLYSLRGIYDDIDLPLYSSWYHTAKFQSNGDPMEDENIVTEIPSEPITTESNITSIQLNKNTISISNKEDYVLFNTYPDKNANDCSATDDKINKIFYADIKNINGEYKVFLNEFASDVYKIYPDIPFYISCNGILSDKIKINNGQVNSLNVKSDNDNYLYMNNISFSFLPDGNYDLYVFAYSKNFPNYIFIENKNNSWEILNNNNLLPYKTNIAGGTRQSIILTNYTKIMKDYSFELYTSYLPAGSKNGKSIFIGENNGSFSSYGINSLFQFN